MTRGGLGEVDDNEAEALTIISWTGRSQSQPKVAHLKGCQIIFPLLHVYEENVMRSTGRIPIFWEPRSIT